MNFPESSQLRRSPLSDRRLQRHRRQRNVARSTLRLRSFPVGRPPHFRARWSDGRGDELDVGVEEIVELRRGDLRRQRGRKRQDGLLEGPGVSVIKLFHTLSGIPQQNKPVFVYGKFFFLKAVLY